MDHDINARNEMRQTVEQLKRRVKNGSRLMGDDLALQLRRWANEREAEIDKTESERRMTRIFVDSCHDSDCPNCSDFHKAIDDIYQVATGSLRKVIQLIRACADQIESETTDALVAKLDNQVTIPEVDRAD